MARSKNFDANELFGDMTIPGRVEPAPKEEPEQPMIKAYNSQSKTEEPVKEIEEPVKVPLVKEEIKPKENVKSAKEPVKESPADLESSYYRARGRKGAGWETLHIRVTNEIKHYINHESCRRGIPKTLLINQIIEQYMNSPQGKAKVD